MAFSNIYKNGLIVILSLIIGLLIAVGYDMYDGGLSVAGDYKIYYWHDVVEYVKSFFNT